MKWVDGVDAAHLGSLDQAMLNSKLLDAVCQGTSMEVRYWIDQGAEVNPSPVADESLQVQMPLLHLATMYQRPTVAEVLVGADPLCVEQTDIFGRTALHVAALEGFGDMTHVLLQMGVDPTQEDNFQLTAADLAQARGHDEVLDAMSGNGVVLELREDVEALRQDVARIYPLGERPFTQHVRPHRDGQDGPGIPGIPIR